MASANIRSRLPVTRVSVIVPAWNEEASLAATLRSVGTPLAGVEVIVVDAASTDATVAVARAHDARVVASPVRRRAEQLNFGVQHATGEVLLFLHADTLLPAGWRADLLESFGADPQLAGGAYRRRFDRWSLWLRLTCRLADWRGRRWGLFLGDQAMFVRAGVFWALGGFRPEARCEDLDFSWRLARHGRTRLLSPMVLSSGRRFAARGPVAQTCADLITAWRCLREASAPTEVEPSARPQTAAVSR